MQIQALIALLLLILSGPAASEWKVAGRFADEHNLEWTEVWKSLDVDAQLCEAIVFPEILRYSRFRDRIEAASLQALYTEGGASKADFSIGIFQMKPSFVERLEEAWMKTEFRKEYELYFDLSPNKAARQKRLKRLKSEQWQCVYLAMFVKLFLEREPSLGEMDYELRLRYLATAYNYSFDASLSELGKRLKIKEFHLDIVRFPRTKEYTYCELSLRRWKELRKRTE